MTHYTWTPRDPLSPSDLGYDAPIGSMRLYGGGIPGAQGDAGAAGPAGADGTSTGVIPLSVNAYYMVTPARTPTTTTMTPITDTIYLMPFHLGAARNLVSIDYYVQTVGAGSTANIAIYTDNDGMPGDLITSVTNNSGVGAASFHTSFPAGSPAIATGQIWVAYVSTGGTPPEVVSGNGHNDLIGVIGGISQLSLNAVRNGYTVEGVPWDDPWVDVPTSVTDEVPQIALTFS